MYARNVSIADLGGQSFLLVSIREQGDGIESLDGHFLSWWRQCVTVKCWWGYPRVQLHIGSCEVPNWGLDKEFWLVVICYRSGIQSLVIVRNNGVVAREPLGPAWLSYIYIVFPPYLTSTSIHTCIPTIYSIRRPHSTLYYTLIFRYQLSSYPNRLWARIGHKS
jgi:hypothetical protein